MKNQPLIEMDKLTGFLELRCSKSIEFIDIKNIVRVESMRSYCKIFTQSNDPIILSTPLKSIEKKLEKYPIFYRSHKSHLINLLYVRGYHSDNGIKLTDNKYIPLSTHLKSCFLEKIREILEVEI